MAAFFAAVNPAGAQGPRAELNKLAMQLQKSGESDKLSKNAAAQFGLTEGEAIKADGMMADEVTDGIDHEVWLLSKNGRPSAFVFSTEARDGNKLTNRFFLVDLSGNLLQTFRVDGEIKGGKPVHGSGKATKLNVKGAPIQRALQHEFDFWLKGLFRRPPAKS